MHCQFQSEMRHFAENMISMSIFTVDQVQKIFRSFRTEDEHWTVFEIFSYKNDITSSTMLLVILIVIKIEYNGQLKTINSTSDKPIAM